MKPIPNWLGLIVPMIVHLEAAGDADEKRADDKRERTIPPGIHAHGFGQWGLPVHRVQDQADA